MSAYVSRETSSFTATRLAAQGAQLLRCFVHQSQSFRPAPALDLLLTRERSVDPIEAFEVEQSHRQPVPRVGGAQTFVVLPHPPLKIAGATYVERTITALENVHVRHSASFAREAGCHERNQ